MENNKALLSATELETDAMRIARHLREDGATADADTIERLIAQARLAAQPVAPRDEQAIFDVLYEMRLAPRHQLQDAAKRIAALAAPVAAQADDQPDDREARELARADQSPVRVTDAELAAFHRFCDCCEDFDAGGHDVPKAMMSELVRIGLLRPAGPSRHETTRFGDWMRDCAGIKPATSAGEADTTASVSTPDDAKDAARFRWMASHRTWHIRYRVKNGKEQWQMLDDGESWGQWGDYRKVIDAAMSATKQEGDK